MRLEDRIEMLENILRAHAHRIRNALDQVDDDPGPEPVPPEPEPDPPIETPPPGSRLVTLGTSIHHAFEQTTWDRVREIGLSSVRFGIQPHSDLDRCISVIRMLNEMGIRVTAHLSAYRWNPNAPKVWPEYVKFCGRVARRLWDEGITNVILEIWNESNHKRFWPWVQLGSTTGPHPWPEHYAMVAVEAAKAIRDANPDVPIMSSGLAPEVPQGEIDFNYIEPMLSSHPILEHVNGVGIHLYRKPVEQWRDPEKMIPNVQRLQEMVSPLPLYCTEFGHPSNEGGEQVQAEMVLRSVLTQWWLGVEHLNIYELTDSGPDPDNREHNYGLFKMDGTIKPAGRAIQYFLERTKGLALTQVGRDDEVFWLEFASSLIVMWPYPLMQTVPAISPVADMYGNAIDPGIITGNPIYIGGKAA